MKRCIQTHHVAGFGEIPEGSLWDDDSPHVQKSEHFADVETPAPAAKAKKPVRKFGAVVAEVADAPTETEER